MLRCWQKRLLNNRERVQYDFNTAGSHTLDIKAGMYDVWLVGAGGGGAMLRDFNTKGHYARGGVGGVICAKINIPRDTTITINIGAGGACDFKEFYQAGTIAQGLSGSQTTITGLENVAISAGGGTGAKVQSTGTYSTNRYVGVQGRNSATGSNIVQILENNVNTILSTQGTSKESSKTPQFQLNTNWLEDTKKGAGGDIGWENRTIIEYNGSAGFVRIKTSD